MGQHKNDIFLLEGPKGGPKAQKEARRAKGGPKGLRLEVGAWRAPELLVELKCNLFQIRIPGVLGQDGTCGGSDESMCCHGKILASLLLSSISFHFTLASMMLPTLTAFTEPNQGAEATGKERRLLEGGYCSHREDDYSRESSATGQEEKEKQGERGAKNAPGRQEGQSGEVQVEDLWLLKSTSIKERKVPRF